MEVLFNSAILKETSQTPMTTHPSAFAFSHHPTLGEAYHIRVSSREVMCNEQGGHLLKSPLNGAHSRHWVWMEETGRPTY
jgi:hypothetical protein